MDDIAAYQLIEALMVDVIDGSTALPWWFQDGESKNEAARRTSMSLEVKYVLSVKFLRFNYFSRHVR